MKLYKEDTYSKVKEYHYPNCTVRVHFPDLTPEEREIRQKMLYDAAVRFVRDVERDKAEKAQQEQQKNAKQE